LQIVETHQQRRLQRGTLQLVLQLLQQPVPLLEHRIGSTQIGGIQQRLRTREKRLEEGRHRDEAVILLRCADADPHACAHGHRRCLLQEPRLSESRAPLDDRDGALAVADRREHLADPLELCAAGG
jgi:hypothetical protein